MNELTFDRYKPKVGFAARARRNQLDRRTKFGIWSRHQKRNPNTEPRLKPKPLDRFGREWLFLKHGEIKLPETVIYGKDYNILIETGKRRAMHTKHPHPLTSKPMRLIDVEDNLNFGPPQYYYHCDPETQYVSYLIYLEFDENHLIKVELDMNKFKNLISQANFRKLQDMVDIIPKWVV